MLLCLKKAPIHHMLNYSIQLITGLHVDVLMWTVVLDNEAASIWVRVRASTVDSAVSCENVCAAYHFEVGLLQLPCPLFQPLSQNSQLCVLSPQPPDLLLGLWGAALPLNTGETNIIIRQCREY